MSFFLNSLAHSEEYKVQSTGRYDFVNGPNGYWGSGQRVGEYYLFSDSNGQSYITQTMGDITVTSGPEGYSRIGQRDEVAVHYSDNTGDTISIYSVGNVDLTQGKFGYEGSGQSEGPNYFYQDNVVPLKSKDKSVNPYIDIRNYSLSKEKTFSELNTGQVLINRKQIPNAEKTLPQILPVAKYPWQGLRSEQESLAKQSLIGSLHKSKMGFDDFSPPITEPDSISSDGKRISLLAQCLAEFLNRKKNMQNKEYVSEMKFPEFADELSQMGETMEDIQSFLKLRDPNKAKFDLEDFSASGVKREMDTIKILDKINRILGED